jgi:hypothetical protein
VRLLVVCGLLLGPLACAGTFEEGRLVGMKERAPHASPSSSASPKVRDEVYCHGKDDQASTWSAVAVGAGALGGGTGLAAIPTTDKTVRLILAIGAAVAGGAALGAAALGKSASSAWARECAGP